MWVGNVSINTLFSSKRWTVSFYNNERVVNNSAFKVCRVGDVATERKGAADPQKMGDAAINYLGLENVRSLTGELVDFAPRQALSVKSRSKIFQSDDLLFGRLRPELNKVYLAQGAVSSGLCSGEFIVLVPKTSVIVPRYLRHALVSSFVTQFVGKFKVGASLPRISSEDLLSIGVPVPPMHIQEQMVRKLEEIDSEIVRLRLKVETLPNKMADAFLLAISDGTGVIHI